MSSEKALTKRILAYLNGMPNSYFFKLHSGGWGNSGLPDIIGHSRGQFFGFEVKNPNGKGRVTPLQLATHEKINRTRPDNRHQLVYVVESLEDVKDAIENR